MFGPWAVLKKVSDFRRKVSADLRKSQKVSVSLTFSLIKLKINYFCAAKSKQTSLTFFSTGHDPMISVPR